MNKEIMIIKNVRGYQDENGVAQLNLEDVSKGLGFTRTATSGNEVIRWERVRKHLKEFGVPTSGHGNKKLTGRDGLPEYIAENIFYKLCFKAENEVARKFQDVVTDEVLPSIRKTGGYIAGEENMAEDELVLKAMNVLNKKVENLRNKNEKLTIENAQQKQVIGELKPKADYLDKILKSKSIVPISYIAKDYGMTAQALNTKLHNLGVQYKIGQTWLLYKEYQAFGYTHSKITEFERKDGTWDTNTTMEWTQKGRLFLYELLKKNGLVPVIER